MDLSAIIGRLHPLAIHFPIGLIAAAAYFLYLSWRKKQDLMSANNDSAEALGLRVCLDIAAIGALAAVVSGWVHAGPVGGDSEDASHVDWHRWTAIIATCFLLLCCWAVRRGSSSRWKLAAFAVATILIFGAGHLGGEITHGEFKFSDDEPIEVRDIPEDEAPDFARDIEPIFKRDCYECHGAKKQRGDLRLDTMNDKEREETAPGQPEKSELFELINLPADDEDLMPQDKGKLSPAEIEVIRRWIQAGAKRP